MIIYINNIIYNVFYFFWFISLSIIKMIKGFCINYYNNFIYAQYKYYYPFENEN